MELPSDEPFNPCGHSRGHGKWLRGRICPAAHKESSKTPAGAHLDLHRRDLFDPVTSVRTVLEAELALQVSSTKKGVLEGAVQATKSPLWWFLSRNKQISPSARSVLAYKCQHKVLGVQQLSRSHRGTGGMYEHHLFQTPSLHATSLRWHPRDELPAVGFGEELTTSWGRAQLPAAWGEQRADSPLASPGDAARFLSAPAPPVRSRALSKPSLGAALHPCIVPLGDM